MVIFYDKTTKKIKRTEDNTQVPILPFNATFEEQKEYYRSQNEDFIGLPIEMGAYIYDYKLGFDTNDNFTGLQAKGVI